MATLTTLRNVVASKIGLDNAAGNEQTLMDEWINQGIVDILLKTRCYVDSADMATQVGVGDYDLDTDILTILEMFLVSGGSTYSLERVTPNELIDMKRRTAAASGPSLYYAVMGSNMLSIYPTPSSVDTITVYYVPRPSALSAGGDDPSTAAKGGIPLEYHSGIEYYALWQAGDYADDGSSENGLTYQMQYEKVLQDIRKNQARKGGSRLAPARVGMRRRRRMVAHDNSMDMG